MTVVTSTDDDAPIWNHTIKEGDVSTRYKTITFTEAGEPVELGAVWSGKVSPAAGEISFDTSDVATGVLHIAFPELDAGVYRFEIECVGDRTYAQGVLTVKRQLP